MSRFGPITERDVDIAEWMHFATLKWMLDIIDRTGLPGVAVLKVAVQDPRARENLREKLEAAS